MELTTRQEYSRMLHQLLPPGPAWPRGDSTSLIGLMIEVWAEELAKVDGRVQALIRESDPRFAVESFDSWLKDWGLPDDCILAWSQANNSVLRTLLLYKIQTIGRQDRSFFIELAEMFGYKIEIEEFRPHTVMSDAMDALAEERWPSTWRVNVLTGAGSVMDYHRVMGGVDEALAWWGDRLIECLIKRYAPAHADLYFGYYSFEDDSTTYRLRKTS